MYKLLKTINCDTHNTHYLLAGTFNSRVAATRAVRKLYRNDECFPREYCLNIIEAQTGRKVSFVYPRGPFVADDCPF